MDVKCSRCNEPWDIYGLTHEDGIFDDPDVKTYPVTVGLEQVYTAEGFQYLAPAGLEEAKEGTVVIIRCPECGSPGSAENSAQGSDEPGAVS